MSVDSAMLRNLFVILGLGGFVVGMRASAEEPDALKTTTFWLNQAVKYCDQSDDLDPDGNVLHQLVYVQARAGDLDGAAKTATKITKAQLRVYGHCFVAKQHDEQGDQAACKSQLDQARTVALEADQKASSVFVNSKIIEAYFDFGYATDAEAFVAALREEHQRRIGYQYVARELAKRGQLDKAYEILAQRLPGRSKDSTLKQMADACARELRLRDFRDIAGRMTSDVHRDLATLNLVNALNRANRLDEAREFVATITDKEKKAQAAAQLSGNTPESESTEEITERIEQASQRDEKLALSRNLFNQQIAAKDISGAEATIEKMVKIIEASPREPEITKFGRSDDSGMIAGVRALYLTTAQALAADGKQQESLQHLEKAKSAIIGLADETGLAKTMLIGQLLQSQIALGDLAGAKNALPSIGIEHTRSTAARALAIAYIRELDMEAACEVAESITATLGRGSQIGAVAAEFVTAGEPFLAQEQLARLDATEEDAEAYRPVARAMIKKGLNADLVKWLESAPSPMARAYACMGAAEQLQGQ
jgi:hypothetical protein